MSEIDGHGVPRNDRYHDERGKHRTPDNPPPGVGTSWARDLRLHIEGHGTAAWVASLLGTGTCPDQESFPPEPRQSTEAS